MRVDKLHKCMGFMMSAIGSMETQMFGSTILICLITYLSQQLLKTKSSAYTAVSLPI